MLVAVISDIHSNMPAFTAVIDRLSKISPDRVLCAGDIVGYYPFPNEVVELVESEKILTIAGNHDRGVLDGNWSNFNDYAAQAARWTKEKLGTRSRAFLGTLRRREELRLGGKKFLMVHGSPRNDDEYVYAPPDGKWPYPVDADILITGHSHIQWSGKFKNLTVLNPGSVGQPRDGDPRAAFATVDTSDSNVKLHRIKYRIDKTQTAVSSAGLPQWLSDRLSCGL